MPIMTNGDALKLYFRRISPGYKIGTDGTMWMLNIEPSYRHKSETMLAQYQASKGV